MDELIARLNIEHFRQRLSEEKDDAKRRMVMKLLAEEKEKLRAIQRRKRVDKQSAKET